MSNYQSFLDYEMMWHKVLLQPPTVWWTVWDNLLKLLHNKYLVLLFCVHSLQID